MERLIQIISIFIFALNVVFGSFSVTEFEPIQPYKNIAGADPLATYEAVSLVHCAAFCANDNRCRAMTIDYDSLTVKSEMECNILATYVTSDALLTSSHLYYAQVKQPGVIFLTGATTPTTTTPHPVVSTTPIAATTTPEAATTTPEAATITPIAATTTPEAATTTPEAATITPELTEVTTTTTKVTTTTPEVTTTTPEVTTTTPEAATTTPEVTTTTPEATTSTPEDATTTPEVATTTPEAATTTPEAATTTPEVTTTTQPPSIHIVDMFYGISNVCSVTSQRDFLVLTLNGVFFYDDAHHASSSTPCKTQTYEETFPGYDDLPSVNDVTGLLLLQSDVEMYTATHVRRWQLAENGQLNPMQYSTQTIYSYLGADADTDLGAQTGQMQWAVARTRTSTERHFYFGNDDIVLVSAQWGTFTHKIYEGAFDQNGFNMNPFTGLSDLPTDTVAVTGYTDQFNENYAIIDVNGKVYTYVLDHGIDNNNPPHLTSFAGNIKF